MQRTLSDWGGNLAAFALVLAANESVSRLRRLA